MSWWPWRRGRHRHKSQEMTVEEMLIVAWLERLKRMRHSPDLNPEEQPKWQ